MRNYTKWKIAQRWNPLVKHLEAFIIHLCDKLTLKPKGMFPVRMDGSFYTWKEICILHKRMSTG